MKKYLKLILTLLIFNNVYSQNVSIKSNPGTPSANIIIGYSNYNVTEALYNDAEIGSNTFTNTGFEISALGVYVSTIGSPTLASGYKIWMKNTTTSSLAVTTYSTAGYTLVFNGSINPTSTGLYKIILNTPFKRISGNNLQIKIGRASCRERV